MVCNFSIDHDSVPVSVTDYTVPASIECDAILFYQPSNKLIRATLHVGMVCQTVASKPVELGKEAELTRENVGCKIIYAANGRLGRV